MKTATMNEIRGSLRKYVESAQTEDVVITRRGKAIGVIHGFATEDDWEEYQLLNDPRFQKRVEQSRQEFRAGKGIRIEKVREMPEKER